jgi:hypothetical protein
VALTTATIWVARACAAREPSVAKASRAAPIRSRSVAGRSTSSTARSSASSAAISASWPSSSL